MQYGTRSILDQLRERKRLVLYLLSFVVVVAVQTALYWWGMGALEGDPKEPLDALNVVVQSLTTTGYGQDAPWESTAVSVLVIVMQFTGVAYLFVAFPLFVVPWLRNAIVEPRIPRAIEDVEDHVVLCQYSSLCSTLVEDLEARDHPYVIVESDEERARELREDDRRVVLGDPSDPETLGNIGLGSARAVVVDVREGLGIDIVLGTRELGVDVGVVCLIEDPEQSQYLRYAGATTVVSPKHRLGKALADKAQNTVSVDPGAAEALDDVSVAEFPVGERSPLFGRNLDEIGEFEDIDATLLGAWVRGEFVTDFSGDSFVDENTVLVVAGTDEQLDATREFVGTGPVFPAGGPVIVAGHGVVGTTAEGILRKAGYETTTIDVEDDETVDLVGDVTDPTTFREAGIDEAGTVLIALPDDEAATLATLVARECDPDVEILVAASEVGSTNRLYSAGADYVLALPKVAGEMTVRELFGGDVMNLQEQIVVTEVPASAVGGDHIDGERVRRETGSIVVGVRRDGRIQTDAEGGFELSEGDRLVVAGPENGIEAFETRYAG